MLSVCCLFFSYWSFVDCGTLFVRGWLLVVCINALFVSVCCLLSSVCLCCLLTLCVVGCVLFVVCCL